MLLPILAEGEGTILQIGPFCDALRGEQAAIRVFGGAPFVGDQRPGGIVQVGEFRIALRFAYEALARLIDILAADLEQAVCIAQRADAAQGSASPVCVTGSPNSSASIFPPRRAQSCAPRMYPMTDGESPVV